ncbi:MAG: hypothetical protein JST85_00210 [Acidobacteria bacterium]|nr:hypothetical protein [Acidobacteriota bacterium]
MLKKIILILGILAACFTGSVAQKNFESLKRWVGKYPRDYYAKPRQNFFKLPEIQPALQKLLNKRDLLRLTEEFGTQHAITQTGDYLEVRVCKSHCCPCEYGALILNLKTGVMHVGIYSEPENEDRWFSTKGSYTDLPSNVRRISFWGK